MTSLENNVINHHTMQMRNPCAEYTFEGERWVLNASVHTGNGWIYDVTRAVTQYTLWWVRGMLIFSSGLNRLENSTGERAPGTEYEGG